MKVVCRVNEEWVEGELGGKRGMFPVSFVDHLPPDLPSKAATTEPTQPSPQVCVRMYMYTLQVCCQSMCVCVCTSTSALQPVWMAFI